MWLSELILRDIKMKYQHKQKEKKEEFVHKVRQTWKSYQIYMIFPKKNEHIYSILEFSRERKFSEHIGIIMLGIVIYANYDRFLKRTKTRRENCCRILKELLLYIQSIYNGFFYSFCNICINSFESFAEKIQDIFDKLKESFSKENCYNKIASYNISLQNSEEILRKKTLLAGNYQETYKNLFLYLSETTGSKCFSLFVTFHVIMNELTNNEKLNIDNAIYSCILNKNKSSKFVPCLGGTAIVK